MRAPLSLLLLLPALLACVHAQSSSSSTTTTTTEPTTTTTIPTMTTSTTSMQYVKVQFKTLHDQILEGVARDLVLRWVTADGLDVEEATHSVRDLFARVSTLEDTVALLQQQLQTVENAHTQTANDLDALESTLASVLGNLRTGCSNNEALVGLTAQNAPRCSGIAPDFDVVQKRLTGGCNANQAVRAVNDDGSIVCNPVVAPATLAPLQNLVNTNLCAYNTWSAWSSCNDDCTRTRTRTVQGTCANPPVLSMTEPCTNGACDKCRGGERWYNINSGRLRVVWTTYDQPTDVYMGMPDGSQVQVSSFANGFKRDERTGAFQHGQYVCATNGPIDVIGQHNNNFRTWIPERFKGMHFLLPVPRANRRALYIFSWEDGSITVKKDSNTYSSRQLEAGKVTTIRFRDDNSAQTYEIDATTPVLITHVGEDNADANSGDVLDFEGALDFFPVVPMTDLPIYGVSSGETSLGSTLTGKMRVQCSDGSGGLGDVSEFGTFRRPNPGRDSMGYGCRYTPTQAGQYIAGVTAGDGDGGDGTHFVRADHMSSVFHLPINCQHISVLCEYFFPPQMLVLNGNGQQVAALSPYNGGVRNGLLRFYSVVANQKAYGTKWVAADPHAKCMLIADAGSGDEFVLSGN